MLDRRENARFGQSYARQREELLRRAKDELKSCLILWGMELLGRPVPAKAKNTLEEKSFQVVVLR